MKVSTPGAWPRLLIANVLLGFLVANANADSPVKGSEVENVTLPLTVEKVWYRARKLHGMKSYEQSGDVTISDSGIEFRSKKGTITVPAKAIKDVGRGMLSPDIMNEWVIVNYSGPTGDEIAAFKAALFTGGDKEGKITSAVLKLLSVRDAATATQSVQ